MGELLSISHDKITRELSIRNYDSKRLWQKVKPYIQELSRSDVPIILSFDDSIEAKPYTDESELICWHWDHVLQQSVKGVNFLTAMAEVQVCVCPVLLNLLRKTTG